ncbi:MAG TPA: YceI family protein [Candidatus Binataceae bacterium]|nr:YceI family protein [Candidatus Binataceae bacterium]
MRNKPIHAVSHEHEKFSVYDALHSVGNSYITAMLGHGGGEWDTAPLNLGRLQACMTASWVKSALVVFAMTAAMLALPARAPAAMVRYVVDPAQCEVFTVVAQPLTKFRGNAIGSFQVRSGEVSGDPANPATGATIKLVLDSASYASGNARRDSVVTGTVLDAADYPDITFVSTGVQDVAMDTPGEGSALIVGNLTLRGSTHSLSALVSVALIGADRLEARGEVTFRYPKFGLPVPTGFLGTIHAGDEVTVKFRIVAQRSAS